jgi:aspartate aminotransferase
MKNLVKKNISSLKPSSTLVINEKSKELISQGKKVYQFGFGQSPFPVPQKIVDTLKDNAHKKEYLPIQGLPKLREAISKYLLKKTGVNYPEKNILITPGSKEAMLLMHVAFKGEIILPAPSWVSYEPQAKIGLNKVHWLQTLRENNWFPTPKELERKIKSVGKNKNIILILNSPNNPSGTVCKNLKEL